MNKTQFEITWYLNYPKVLQTKNKHLIQIKSSGVYICELKDLKTNKKWITKLVKVKLKYKLKRLLYDLVVNYELWLIIPLAILIVYSVSVAKYIETKDTFYNKLVEAFINDFNLKTNQKVEIKK